MKRIIAYPVVIATLFLVAFSGFAQVEVVKNPRAVAFICPDHATDDTHEIAIIRASDNVTIQTLSAGDPALNPTGEVEVALNVQPMTFGQYVIRSRAGGNGIWSEWSEPTAVWERAPGKPSGVIVR